MHAGQPTTSSRLGPCEHGPGLPPLAEMPEGEDPQKICVCSTGLCCCSCGWLMVIICGLSLHNMGGFLNKAKAWDVQTACLGMTWNLQRCTSVPNQNCDGRLPTRLSIISKLFMSLAVLSSLSLSRYPSIYLSNVSINLSRSGYQNLSIHPSIQSFFYLSIDLSI